MTSFGQGCLSISWSSPAKNVFLSCGLYLNFAFFDFCGNSVLVEVGNENSSAQFFLLKRICGHIPLVNTPVLAKFSLFAVCVVSCSCGIPSAIAVSTHLPVHTTVQR